MSLQLQSHRWHLFHLSNPKAKLYFISLQPCAAGWVRKPIFHFMLLVKQPYGRGDLAAPTLAHRCGPNISLSQGQTIFIFPLRWLLKVYHTLYSFLVWPKQIYIPPYPFLIKQASTTADH